MSFADSDAEVEAILGLIAEFRTCGDHSMGIICKTHRQAECLYEAIHPRDPKARLLSPHSLVFRPGVIICGAHMSKGLEFDRVVVSGVEASNYHSAMDRGLFYVACTRAMHRLTLTGIGVLSSFLPLNPFQNLFE